MEKLRKIPYGGDYNPEQWPEEIWEEDMRLLKAAGIDTVTLNTFSWAAVQPSEEAYDFSKLDKIMDLAEKNGLQVILATSTGAHPPWMARRYPDVLRTEFNGMKRKYGGRHNSCPNSPSYRMFSARLAGKLAERYGRRKNLIAWHISNEYGGECYCENCEKAFRQWLKKKYHTLEELNRAWNTSFWSHTFYDWDEIVLPNLLSEHFEYDRTTFQPITLDYKRFNSDSILECFLGERAAILERVPGVPITTNLMGFYKMLDYKKWAPYMDFISWDNYPANEDPPAKIAMNHDLMRGIKGGEPFWLMEQTPSVTNWLPYNALKRPGIMRLWSWQAVAHGADAVLFFQMRRSVGACEKLHGAVIDHVGTGETRVYREVAALGEELKGLGNVTLGARTKAETALYMDWDNWWAIEMSAGPNRELKYLDELFCYYEAFFRLNIPVDIIGPEDSLDGYKLVAAPLLYMTKQGYDDKIREYVKGGGTFITTYFSGLADENDKIILGGYPGRLRDILGIWAEESDALPNGEENHFQYKGKTYPAKLVCDLLHLEGANALTSYGEDFYKGMPVLTAHSFGKGKAWYMASRSSREFYLDWMKDVLEECGICSLLPPKEGLEVTARKKDGKTFLFLLNHGKETAAEPLEVPCRDLLSGKEYKMGEAIVLPPAGIGILELKTDTGKI